MEKEEYVKKWLDGTLDEDEKRVFAQTAEYKSLQKLSESVTAFRPPGYDVAAEYNRLSARVPSKGKVVLMTWLNPLLKIAAVLTVVAGSYFYFVRDSQTIVETLAAETTELILPDSSFVAISPLSRVSFNENDWEKIRKVQLEGEAFFKVAKGARFDVETTMGTVSVLGTAFTVKRRNDFFEVTCFEGSVRVQHEQEVVKLLPIEMFRVIDGVISRQNLETDSTPDWRNSESSFKSTPFRYVLAEFERQYNVTIVTQNVDIHQLFTGKFIHTDLALALNSITIPLNFTFKIVGDKKIVLTGDLK